MKKLALALILVSVMLMTGCNASKIDTKESALKEESNIQAETKSDSQEVSDAKKAAPKEEKEESNIQEEPDVDSEKGIDPEETDSEEENDSLGEMDYDPVKDEDYLDNQYRETFEYYDAEFNSQPIDLTPRIGEFYSEDPYADDPLGLKSDSDGTIYGFEDDLTAGCSVWCSVQDYISEVTATSQLSSTGNNTYVPANLENRDRMTAWVEGVAGDGISEKIFIRRTYERGGDVPKDMVSRKYDSFFFPELCIVNGYAKNEAAWKNNGRVKTMKMYFNDEYVCTLELEDTMKPQYISLNGFHLSAKSGEESLFTFEIEDVYKGDKYDDTAITGIEIRMFTQNH